MSTATYEMVPTHVTRDLELSETPTFDSPCLITQLPDGRLAVTYAAPDDGSSYGPDWALGEGVELSEFGHESDRDDHIRDLRRLGVVPSRIYVVNHTDHGTSTYSVAYGMTRPIRRYRPADRWDTVPSMVLVLPEDVPVHRRRAFAEAVLDNYTQWANGWLQRIVTDIFSSSPEGWVLVDTESVGGFFEADITTEALTSYCLA